MKYAPKIVRPATLADLERLPPTWRGKLIDDTLYAFPRPPAQHANIKGYPRPPGEDRVPPSRGQRKRTHGSGMGSTSNVN